MGYTLPTIKFRLVWGKNPRNPRDVVPEVRTHIIEATEAFRTA